MALILPSKKDHLKLVVEYSPHVYTACLYKGEKEDTQIVGFASVILTHTQ